MKKSTLCLTALMCTASYAMADIEPVSVIFTSPTGVKLPYDVYVAGSHNQWQMNANSIMVWEQSKKQYRFNIQPVQHPTSFNLFKEGDWQNPMATKFGKPFTCGFVTEKDGPTEFSPSFLGWAKDNENPAKDTTVGTLVTINDFPMQTLQRNTDIYVLLPDNYQQAKNKHYQVAYMLDGQNLFSESLSYSYEWQVDETLNNTNMDLIVVGVANGPNRWQEYSPWDSVNYMGQSIKGSGKDTITFIKNELKPYIDQNYRTLTAAENTALMGSSLGGLMALYAGIEHSDTFGKIGAFSPAFSFQTMAAQQSLNPDKSNLIQSVKASNSGEISTRFYFDMGEVEYGSFALVDSLHHAFSSAGYQSSQLKLVKDKLGRHCELDWSRRLPVALDWLFNSKQR